MEQKQWTIDEVHDLVEKFHRLSLEIKTIKEEEKILQEEKRNIESSLLEYFTQTGTSSVTGRNDVKLHVRKSLSFKTPKDPESKKRFFEYLKQKGEDVFWSYITVNSQSLNAFCKKEIEVHNDQGDQVFNVPGIDTPTHYEKVILQNK